MAAIPTLCSGRHRLFQNIGCCCSPPTPNLCVLVFQMAIDLLGQIVIKLFGPNYLLNRSVRYFFWPKDFVNW